MNDIQIPKVGIGLLVVRDDHILLGKRLISHGTGEYGGPGGHLDPGESFEECALRELVEEAGDDFKIKNIRFLCVTRLLKYLPKDYVDIGMIAEYESGEPRVMEPHKLESWNWHPIAQPPGILFGCMENYFEARQTGRVYFDKA